MATVAAALADPEPATKLGLAGLTMKEAAELMLLLGITSSAAAGSAPAIVGAPGKGST